MCFFDTTRLVLARAWGLLALACACLLVDRYSCFAAVLNLLHQSLRTLAQKVPEAISSSAHTVLMRRRHLGLRTEKPPLQILHQLLLTELETHRVHTWGLTREGRALRRAGAPHGAGFELAAVFSVLRMVSEAPLSRDLRNQGLDGFDDCARTGSTVACGGSNASLLAVFYRHRHLGIPWAKIHGQLIAHDDPLARCWILLAAADRRRSAGADRVPEVSDGLKALVQALKLVSLEETLPTYGPPLHLAWHLLDKLSLPLRVNVGVEPPSIKVGSAPPSEVPKIWMSVLPDRDIISDYVRRNHQFHCSPAFQEVLANISQESTSEGRALTILEVGGFLGDCLLWAVAWLGPERIRALEVEPAAVAMAQFSESLARNGFNEAVDGIAAIVGDGKVHQVHLVAEGSAALAHPNFALCSLEPIANSQCAPLRLRTLDEILENWPRLQEGDVVDLVRVKASRSEDLIIAGMRQHLTDGRIRCLLVERDPDQGAAILHAMAEWPRYRLDQDRYNHELQKHSFLNLVFRLDR